ncbi:MAG: PfkB family carbohydrate kinase [bacterium]
MIITVTANPMVEHVFPVKTLTPGRAHHPADSWAFATGKGINVARALFDLGEDVLAVVACGGERGREITHRLADERIPVQPVGVSGESRIGFVTYHRGDVTTLYGPGPTLTDEDVDAIVDAVAAKLPAQLLVLAGSVSHPELYPRLCALNSPLVLDFKHPCFRQCLDSSDVVLAKPNRQESRFLLAEDNPQRAATLLTDAGARWAVVTDGAGSAVFRTGGHSWLAEPPAVEAAHPVGCGDALCAGLIHTLDRDPRDAVAFAMACGAHNASRPDIGHLDRSACRELAKSVRMTSP